MDPMFSTADPTTGQVGMTMAAIAYVANPTAIATLLANPSLATKGRWSLDWFGRDDGNQAYVARDQQSGQYAIAIRGSATDPFSPAFWIDWFQQDGDVVLHVDWKFGGAPAHAMIARGTSDGLDSLLSLRDRNGRSVLDFFAAIPKPPVLTAVVGHSLGGALAQVLAARLHQQFSPGQNVLDFWPVTFAAPTTGNDVFAGWLETQFAASVGRYHNRLDVVPHAWAGLKWIKDSFPGGGPALPLPLRAPVDLIRDILRVEGIGYEQPGPGNPLDGTLLPNVDWFGEAGSQHASTTYLSLLGAPPIPPETVLAAIHGATVEGRAEPA